MKHIITNYRYWILAMLGFFVVIGLVIVPQDTASFLAYIAILIASKLIALAAAYCFILLYAHWLDNGQIQDLANLANEE